MNQSRCSGGNSSTSTWNKFTVVYLKSLELYLWTRRFGCLPQKDKRCNALQRVTLRTRHKPQIFVKIPLYLSNQQSNVQNY